MPENTPFPRYKTFPADMPPEERAALAMTADEPEEEGRLDRGIRYLTWGILAICLALWAVVGFILWVPLLLRSMLHFSFALSQSMLQGAEPVEAGRVLRETVAFYRRGFTVAIDAVFGESPRKKEREREVGLSPRRLLFEVLWAVVVWYLVLLVLGFVEASPLDGWNALLTLPWADLWGSLVEGVSDLFGGPAGSGESAPPA